MWKIFSPKEFNRTCCLLVIPKNRSGFNCFVRLKIFTNVTHTLFVDEAANDESEREWERREEKK